MKIKALIVEDKSHTRRFFKKVYHHFYEDKIEIVAICNFVETVLASIKKYESNLVSWDIQIPVLNKAFVKKEIPDAIIQ